MGSAEKAGDIVGKKGYAFTLDAVLATVVFSMLVIGSSFGLSKKELGSEGAVQMQKTMNDALDLMDHKKILQTMDSNSISGYLNSALPDRFDWKLKIERYVERGTSVELFDSTEFGNTAFDTSQKQVAKGRRTFLAIGGGQVDYFSSAEYWVWMK